MTDFLCFRLRFWLRSWKWVWAGIGPGAGVLEYVCELSECFISLSWLRPKSLWPTLCLISRCEFRAVFVGFLYSFYHTNVLDGFRFPGNGQAKYRSRVGQDFFCLPFVPPCWHLFTYLWSEILRIIWRGDRAVGLGGPRNWPLSVPLPLPLVPSAEAFRPAYLAAWNFLPKRTQGHSSSYYTFRIAIIFVDKYLGRRLAVFGFRFLWR